MTLSKSLTGTLGTSCGLALLLFTAHALFPPAAAALDDPLSLIDHLRTELRSEAPDRQERALIDAIKLARCKDTCEIRLASATGGTIRLQNDTGLHTTVGIEHLIPDLLEIYRRSPTPGHRQLALAALINTENEAAFEQLIEAKEQQGRVVRRATDHALAGYYLGRYPELVERSIRRRTLSLRDVSEAAAQRERSAGVHARAETPD